MGFAPSETQVSYPLLDTCVVVSVPCRLFPLLYALGRSVADLVQYCQAI